MRLAPHAFFAAAFVACGGATLEDVLGGGGDAGSALDAAVAAETGTSLDAGAASDGQPDRDGGRPERPDAAPVDPCPGLRAAVETSRPRAAECIPLLPTLQCDGVVEDICCEITVNKASIGTKAVKDFIAAVSAFKSKCDSDCNRSACPDVPTGICQPQGLGGVCL